MVKWIYLTFYRRFDRKKKCKKLRCVYLFFFPLKSSEENKTFFVHSQYKGFQRYVLIDELGQILLSKFLKWKCKNFRNGFFYCVYNFLIKKMYPRQWEKMSSLTDVKISIKKITDRKNKHVEKKKRNGVCFKNGIQMGEIHSKYWGNGA